MINLVEKFTEGKPPNYEELKRKANDKVSWRNRLEAVEELKKWKCRESIDILWRRMMSDNVRIVQESAFRGLQRFGENVKLPRKKKGKFKGINKKLLKTHDALNASYLYEEFKIKFKKKYPEEYDTYEGNKQEKFDEWLKNSISSLPKKKEK